MTAAPDPRPCDARWAMALLAVDAVGLGGALVRGPADPAREAWLAAVRAHVTEAGEDGASRPWRRVPLHVDEQRVLGGLDLAATLAAGRAVAERGLIAEAERGVLVLAGAERVAPLTAAHIGTALDAGRVAVIALDEGVGEDERAPPGLADRLAFHLDVATFGGVATFGALGDDHDDDDTGAADPTTPEAIDGARRRLTDMTMPDELLAALTTTAVAAGIASLRAPVLAVRAARAIAALAGRTEVTRADVEIAARLVLAPRATRLPVLDAPTDEEAPPEPPADPPQESSPPDDPDTAETRDPAPDPERPLDELMVEAVRAAIPAGLLALLERGLTPPARRQSIAGRTGAERRSGRGGRPAGTRPGDPRRGGRLALVATLRAAAPWQPLRTRERAIMPDDRRRLEVRRADLRIRRFREPTGTVLIFAVDASGSAALARLAEAKGAVELLLADCYVRRDEVAVLAFRGAKPEVLLPPTRSLVRAKRALADLPGGGATPLAGALDAVADLARRTRRQGRQPAVVLLTDGRANVTRDGRQGRAAGEADALAAAGALRALGVATLVIDTAPRPQAQAASLAAALAARYVPLPHAEARQLSAVVRRELGA